MSREPSKRLYWLTSALVVLLPYKELTWHLNFASFYQSCKLNGVEPRKVYNFFAACTELAATAIYSAHVVYLQAQSTSGDYEFPVAYRDASFERVLTPQIAHKLWKYVFTHPEYFDDSSPVNQMSQETFQAVFNDVFSDTIKNSSSFRAFRELVDIAYQTA